MVLWNENYSLFPVRPFRQLRAAQSSWRPRAAVGNRRLFFARPTAHSYSHNLHTTGAPNQTRLKICILRVRYVFCAFWWEKWCLFVHICFFFRFFAYFSKSFFGWILRLKMQKWGVIDFFLKLQEKRIVIIKKIDFYLCLCWFSAPSFAYNNLKLV